MAKSKNNEEKGAETPEPAFEESLTELQQIVVDLEDGALGLEESLQRFESGVVLLRRCYRILEQAEQKIEILTGTDADGNPITADFNALPTTTEPAAGRRKPKAAKRTSKQTDKLQSEPESNAEDKPGKTLF
jgi:exodeoxyribonuclease VII small subunit